MIRQATNVDIVTLLKSYGPIPEAAESDILSHVSRLHRAKGQRIIREGQVATSFFVVEHGMVRSFCQKKQAEVTLWFAYEGQIAVAISSFYLGNPSRETVECLEDCDLLSISGTDLQSLYAKHESLNTIGRRIAETYCNMLDERAYSFQVMSAAERYEALMANCPEVVRRAPLSHVASFLGMSQETLSRVRHSR